MSDMMTLAQVRPWLSGARQVECGQDSGSVSFKRVHTDSRTVEPGDLFVALQGEHFDAHHFLAQAQAQGAVAALCQDTQSGTTEALLQAAHLPGLLVRDTKRALAELATHWRAQFKLPVIAVTGSNGKTTVTQMIAAILHAYRPQAFLATQGNFNNDIGVPLTLLRLRAEHAIAVVELGMNHPGEIAMLAAMAQPTVALVNNAQREHLEFMGTVQAVAQENGSVIDALSIDGVAVFPSDDHYSALWRSKAGPRPGLQFSLTDGAADTVDVVCRQAQWAGDAWYVTAITPAGSLSYTLHIAGRHNLKNSLAALACTLAAGVPLAVIAQGLSAFAPVKGRCRAQLLQQGEHAITLVDDTYNANPDSVRAAIEVLASLSAPRLLVLGDMGEVGEQGSALHAEAGQLARELGIDTLFTLGDLSDLAAKGFGNGHHFESIEALQSAVLAELPSASSVLVKGSRFMKMERVVQVILEHTQTTQGVSHVA